MLVIEPLGRLGNNIAQILKCICYSLSFKNPVKIDLTLLKNSNSPYFDFLPDYIFDNNEINIRDTFWNYWDHWDANFLNGKKILCDLFSPLTSIKLNINLEDKLVIHFRGGDSFNKNDPNWWKHPPYYFYKNIIDNSNYNEIILVIEDNSNPIINKLAQNYKNIKITHNDYITDFIIIANSINLVDSQSSFTSSALLINNKLKTLYTSPQMHTYIKKYENINLINYDLDKYTNNTTFTTYNEFIEHLLLDQDPNKST
jgi:hypothetical protein